MICISLLKSYAASYPANPARTTDLEQQIRIGSGFHNKWYRSQREHMLGWLVVQECQARKGGKLPESIDASAMWGRLKCSPMMFWLGECAGVSDEILTRAAQTACDAANINPRDGEPHGKMMRTVLPWSIVRQAILLKPVPYADEKTLADARDAFERLTHKVPAYRPLREWNDK